MNIEYYILIDNEQKGPYTLEELRGRRITPDTLVWRSGLAEWVKASALPEWNDMGYSVPPRQPQTAPVMPKTWLVESILVTIFCCLPCGVMGIVYASRVENLYLNQRYAEAMESSRMAKVWTLVGFFVIVGLGVIWLVCSFLFGLFSGDSMLDFNQQSDYPTL